MKEGFLEVTGEKYGISYIMRQQKVLHCLFYMEDQVLALTLYKG